MGSSRPERQETNTLQWKVIIGTDGEVRVPLDFVGPFLADRLRWEADRRVAPANRLEPGGHATTAEFAATMRLSVRTVRTLLRSMTLGQHYFRQGRRVVIIVDEARKLLQERNLLSSPSTGDLAENELRQRKGRISKRERRS